MSKQVEELGNSHPGNRAGKWPLGGPISRDQQSENSPTTLNWDSIGFWSHLASAEKVAAVLLSGHLQWWC